MDVVKQKATNKKKLNNGKNKNEEKKCKKVRLWDLSDHAIHDQTNNHNK